MELSSFQNQRTSWFPEDKHLGRTENMTKKWKQNLRILVDSFIQEVKPSPFWVYSPICSTRKQQIWNLSSVLCVSTERGRLWATHPLFCTVRTLGKCEWEGNMNTPGQRPGLGSVFMACSSQWQFFLRIMHSLTPTHPKRLQLLWSYWTNNIFNSGL